MSIHYLCQRKTKFENLVEKYGTTYLRKMENSTLRRIPSTSKYEEMKTILKYVAWFNFLPLLMHLTQLLLISTVYFDTSKVGPIKVKSIKQKYVFFSREGLKIFILVFLRYTYIWNFVIFYSIFNTEFLS